MVTVQHPTSAPPLRQMPVDVHGLPHQLAWDLLCCHEPALRHLEMDMRGRRRSWRNYEWFKQRATQLVGWFARNPRLRTDDAYDVAIRRIANKVAP